MLNEMKNPLNDLDVDGNTMAWMKYQEHDNYCDYCDGTFKEHHCCSCNKLISKRICKLNKGLCDDCV